MAKFRWFNQLSGICCWKCKKPTTGGGGPAPWDCDGCLPDTVAPNEIFATIAGIVAGLPGGCLDDCDNLNQTFLMIAHPTIECFWEWTNPSPLSQCDLLSASLFWNFTGVGVDTQLSVLYRTQTGATVGLDWFYRSDGLIDCDNINFVMDSLQGSPSVCDATNSTAAIVGNP